MMQPGVSEDYSEGSTGLTTKQRDALTALWRVLPKARLVGGVVRDLLAGRPVSDIDLATPEPPAEVLASLKAAGIKVVPTGLAHGTVTAVMEGQPYEITTLRRDVTTDGRHASVCWTSNWAEDAKRRDFTINAMFRDRHGQLTDYFGGQADLAAGRVRFVGEASARIREDALRILRFFRFQGRYGGAEPDAEAISAIRENADWLKRLSVERIWSEMQKILTGQGARGQVRLMEETGVLSVLFPSGVTISRFDALLAAGAPADPVLRLAALIAEDPSGLARRLKLSRAETRYLVAVSCNKAPATDISDDALRCLLSDKSKDLLLALVWLAQADASFSPSVLAESFIALRARIRDMPVPVFPLAGKHLCDAGLATGPDIGRVLTEVRQWWQQHGCQAGLEACLKQAMNLRQIK